MFYNRTYFDKCATIVRGSDFNTGLNPVSELVWGRNLSRFLVHFDHSKLKKMVDDETYADISKLHHRLKITNAGSLDMSETHKVYQSQIDGDAKKRTSSFDLIFFLIPELWDEGKGFDYSKSYFNTDYYDKQTYDYALYKLQEGVNWHQSRSGYDWKEEDKYQKSKKELFDFYIKANKKVIAGVGDTVTFRFYCECGVNKCNTGLKLELTKSVGNDNKIEIGTPVYFAKNGNICKTKEQKERYCDYVEVAVKIPENDSGMAIKRSFRVSLTINEDDESLKKEFKSLSYRITQLSKTQEFYPQTEDGVYSTHTLEKELDKYLAGKKSIVIGTQHFDNGLENIDVDITPTVNKFIKGELENYGIGIAFSPKQEYSDSIYENYIGLLTNKTNSFFEPFLETTYDGIIEDDRANFIPGKDNHIYLYSNIGNKLTPLDELPTCTIEVMEDDEMVTKSFPVSVITRGVYCATVNLPISGYTSPTMLYDVWDNLKYQGNPLPPVELNFTTQDPFDYFKLDNTLPGQNEFTPNCYGIKNNEQIRRGDIRKINIVTRKNYSKNTAVRIGDIYARLYVMDGTAQCDVIPYHKVNRGFAESYTEIDTSILPPNQYFLDVKIIYGMECIEHQDVLRFTIVNDLNNKYN